MTVDALHARFKLQIAPGDDYEFLRLLAEADLRLLETAKWRWTRSRVDLTPVSSLVTLPATHASILAARVDTVPVHTWDEEYEFVPEGIGEVEVGGTGDTRLIDQGLNGSGLRYYKVTSQSDDAITIHTLCLYAPRTLYFADDLPGPPAVTDSNETLCPSAGALKLAMLAIVYEEAGEMGQSAHYMATALRNLENRGQSRRGGAKQTVNLNLYGPGVSGIRSFR